jgi:hypothetical protein
MCSLFQYFIDGLEDNLLEIENFLEQRVIEYHLTQPGIEYLLAPIFMMTMCARGFILWIINVGLVIYLSVAAIKLNKKVC